MSKKNPNSNAKIILSENSKLVTDQKEVSEIFNEFFVNVADEIGKGVSYDSTTHPSICKIRENIKEDKSFSFSIVTESKVSKLIDKLQVKKATGADKLSCKILKLGKPVLQSPLTGLINLAIQTSTFPEHLKRAQVTPIHKKNDTLSKTNYRPVSILKTTSKLYEKVLSEQLSQYFDNILDQYMCAFRKGHGCQTTLLRLLEDWKMALDRNEFVAAVLMDLSKAFDCLPHDILLSKLSAYGLCNESLNLLKSYLSGRTQQVKLNGIVSSWSAIKKGVPQGSILGPLSFNVFINDIFYFLEHGTLYNYADDNTVSFSTPDLDKLIQILQSESQILLNWFHENCMQANPDKFQAIAVGEKTFAKNLVLKISNSEIKCEKLVKLFGIDIDYQLNFDQHISSLCRKAGQQLNVLKRLSPFLSKLSRLTIFYTFILSNFNYCPLAWHFCSENNSRKLEKIQERALRFVFSDFVSTYDELLLKANIPSLHIRRLKTMSIETFKVLNEMAPPVLSNLVRLRDNSRYNFRYNNILQVPQVRTTKYGKNSFRYAAAVLWNSFPDKFRQVNNFSQFKSLLANWNGGDCRCNLCR